MKGKVKMNANKQENKINNNALILFIVLIRSGCLFSYASSGEDFCD